MRLAGKDLNQHLVLTKELNVAVPMGHHYLNGYKTNRSSHPGKRPCSLTLSSNLTVCAIHPRGILIPQSNALNPLFNSQST